MTPRARRTQFRRQRRQVWNIKRWGPDDQRAAAEVPRNSGQPQVVLDVSGNVLGSGGSASCREGRQVLQARDGGMQHVPDRNVGLVGGIRVGLAELSKSATPDVHAQTPAPVSSSLVRGTSR